MLDFRLDKNKQANKKKTIPNIFEKKKKFNSGKNS